MPVDPDISLQIQPQQQQSINPLGMMNSVMEMRQRQLAMQQLQMQMAARARVGEIAAGSGDMDDFMNKFTHDPSFAWVPEVGQLARATQLTEQQLSAGRQKQFTDAYTAGLGLSAGSVNDPGIGQAINSNYVKGLPPEIAAKVKPALDALHTAVTALPPGVDPNSDAAVSYRAKNASTIMAAGGTDPKLLQSIFPSYETKTGPFGREGAEIPYTVKTAPFGGGQTLIPQGPSSGGDSSSAGAYGGGNPLTLAPPPVGAAAASPYGGMALPQPKVTTGQQAVQGPAPAAPDTNVVGKPPAPTPSAPLPVAPSPGPAAFGLSGPSVASTETQKKLGDYQVDYQRELDDTVDLGANAVKTMSELRNAIKGFQPGPGTSWKASLAGLFSSLGADPKTVAKIAGGDIGDIQEAMKLGVDTIIGRIQKQIPEGSHLNKNEFETFRQYNPNVDTPANAIEHVFNFWTKLYNQDLDQQTQLQAHLKAGLPFAAWPNKWQQIQQQKGYVNPDENQPLVTGGTQGKKPTVPLDQLFK